MQKEKLELKHKQSRNWGQDDVMKSSSVLQVELFKTQVTYVLLNIEAKCPSSWDIHRLDHSLDVYRQKRPLLLSRDLNKDPN